MQQPHVFKDGDVLVPGHTLADMTDDQLRALREEARTHRRRLGFPEHISLDEACRIAGGVHPDDLRALPALEIQTIGQATIVSTDRLLAVIKHAVHCHAVNISTSEVP